MQGACYVCTRYAQRPANHEFAKKGCILVTVILFLIAWCCCQRIVIRNKRRGQSEWVLSLRASYLRPTKSAKRTTFQHLAASLLDPGTQAQAPRCVFRTPPFNQSGQSGNQSAHQHMAWLPGTSTQVWYYSAGILITPAKLTGDWLHSVYYGIADIIIRVRPCQ